MVYLDSSSARTVDCALNTIYSELIIAKERLATDTENGIILHPNYVHVLYKANQSLLTLAQEILTNLLQTYAGIMESIESLSAFWSLTDRQAITWVLQNVSKLITCSASSP
jgi:hypothetical protein